MSFFEQYTQDEVRVIVAEKDAEIARMKSEIEDWKENERRALSLITELADALEKRIARSGNKDFPRKMPDIDMPLVQRAREATRHDERG